MCGRYSLTRSPEQLAATFTGISFEAVKQRPRYNVSPSQQVLGVANEGPQGKAEFFRWGLIPSWAKDEKIGYKMINARADGIAEKPSFRAAWKKRHCAVFVDGFFEWRTVPGQKNKQPMYFQMKDGSPFAFAGLWEVWTNPESGELVRSCTVITTEPNELVAKVHDRMPVILRPDQVGPWLNSVSDLEAAKRMLVSFPADAMRVSPVSLAVNSPKNDTPECVSPAA